MIGANVCRENLDLEFLVIVVVVMVVYFIKISDEHRMFDCRNVNLLARACGKAYPIT